MMQGSCMPDRCSKGMTDQSRQGLRDMWLSLTLDATANDADGFLSTNGRETSFGQSRYRRALNN
jgi:hypothetical protein